jgi:hypothetical protein
MLYYFWLDSYLQSTSNFFKSDSFIFYIRNFLWIWRKKQNHFLNNLMRNWKEMLTQNWSSNTVNTTLWNHFRPSFFLFNNNRMITLAKLAFPLNRAGFWKVLEMVIVKTAWTDYIMWLITLSTFPLSSAHCRILPHPKKLYLLFWMFELIFSQNS